MSQDDKHKAKPTSAEALNAIPSAVPTFNCLVYVSKTPDSRVHARVANLPGIEYTASSERDALTRIVAAFKKQVAAMLQESPEIPWVDPIPEPEPGEDKRFLPVHL